MHYQDPNISKLISGFAKGSLNQKEQEELDTWLKNEQHQHLFKKALRKNEILEKSIMYDTFNKEQIWDNIDKELFSKKIGLNWYKYVAAIILPVLITIGIIYITDTPQPELTHDVIMPGVNKATLFLSDGSTVVLDDNVTNQVVENGLVIGVDSLNTLEYIDAEVSREVINTLRIPVGGEYHVKLSDGTIVWLNSDSELRYPVNFVGDKREVYLKGEGFFDVKHDATSPFIVHTDHSDVTVYGTRFNVMSYSDDAVEQVTLVDGKVGVTISQQQTILSPGQQSELNLNSNKLALKDVDTSYYTGWVDGVMKFKNMPLKDLSKRISRWYDVDFYFANSSVAEFGFSGKFDRDCDFNLLMELLERTTNVKIEVNDRTVVVKEVQ
jgi:ferric-dicitrate binding protein FerR (iron transport regulator)